MTTNFTIGSSLLAGGGRAYRLAALRGRFAEQWARPTAEGRGLRLAARRRRTERGLFGRDDRAERGHALGVESAAGFVVEQRQRSLGRPCLAAYAVRGECVVDVGDGEDADLEVEVPAGTPFG
jgi:hypothetical protein